MMRSFTIFLLTVISFYGFAQTKNIPKPNWQNLDLQQDGVFGISTERAYLELLKGKVATPVVVAVIDGGVDIGHEDLKQVIWVNTKEIAGNGIDDDHNGYVDDVNGWDFIGSSRGDVQYDNLELVRLIRKMQPKYASALNSTKFTDAEQVELNLYRKLVTNYMDELENAQMGLAQVTIIKKTMDSLVVKMGKSDPTLQDFNRVNLTNDTEKKVLKVIKSLFDQGKDFKQVNEEINDGLKYYTSKVNYHLNIDFDPRELVGDNYLNSNEHFYGNNDVTGPDAEHGTHVSGIIAASRANTIGILGVADQAHIMAIRVVPDGDERDKDVANGIRYAADNGAKVINMSFGKAYAWDKKVVDEAVKYALSKDVLLVHAAGNETKNIEKQDNFPNKYFGDSTSVNKGQADAWIEVGASSWKDDEDLIASFSNYGKKAVDVFAPGVKIRSTIPNSLYKEADGTSMAAPMVSGLAALIRSYYPKLTALQVKNAIMNSVTEVGHKVKIKVNGDTQKVLLKDICVTGGIINAYKALQLAEKM
ncbi:MAG: S8 family peptidase [Sphingobacteriaceae bacterium]